MRAVRGSSVLPLAIALLALLPACGRRGAPNAPPGTPPPIAGAKMHFPPPGESLAGQDPRAPAEVGLDPDIVAALDGIGQRWALWRHGHLVHVEGDFNATDEVKSLVKVWFAMTVGAGLQQGKIPSTNQRLSVWQTNLTGNDALATWWHAMTQSTGFDYPGCGDGNDYLPGQMWTYSDLNMHELNHALARAFGRTGYDDQYELVWRQAFFDAIGMTGWSNEMATDHVRLVLDLEDMGRLGLLALNRGAWGDPPVQLVPASFVAALETKSTAGMQVNYNGCNDGGISLSPSQFPEAPYGYLCWTNSAGDYFPGADRGWTFGSGAGGFMILWNRNNGIVFAGVGVDNSPTADGLPHAIERNITGPNPLVR